MIKDRIKQFSSTRVNVLLRPAADHCLWICHSGLYIDKILFYLLQVAVQFWKAIGGDEEEILGLSDCESD